MPRRISPSDFPPHILAGIARHHEQEQTTMQKQTPTAGRTERVLDEVDQVLATHKGTDTGEAAVSEVERLVAEAVDHDEQAKRHTEAAKAAKERLRELLGQGSHDVGNLKVTVSKPRQAFDADAFQADYPKEANPYLYKDTLDAAAIPPKLKNEYMRDGTTPGAVTIK